MNQFKISTYEDFEKKAIELFKIQYKHNQVYNKYCSLLGVNAEKIKNLIEIPFLPIQIFKTHKVVSNKKKHMIIFESSGTSGIKSKHYVTDLDLYKKSFTKSFERFYGYPNDYLFLALLPGYFEQKNSSLVYMINYFIQLSKYKESEFYLYNYKKLYDVLIKFKKKKIKIILFGVTHALLDFISKYRIQMKNLIVIETGGMKGKNKEISRDELHLKLKKGFGTNNIHSEYGMTELFSQGYSIRNGVFENPPWMKLLVRDRTNPLSNSKYGTGAINVIDLANENSCSFIATDDYGKVNPNGSYEIIGRLEQSQIRGCNLMFNNN